MIDQAPDGAPAVVTATAVTADFPRKTVLGMIFVLLALSGAMMAADLLGWLPRPELFG